METWKLLLITLLSAVLIGCIIGVLVGKHQLKKKREDYRPLLSIKERIIYTLCILLGIACIAVGVRYNTSDDNLAADGEMGMEGEMMPGIEGGMMGEEGAMVDNGIADSPEPGMVDGGMEADAENPEGQEGDEAESTANPDTEAEAAGDDSEPTDATAEAAGGGGIVVDATPRADVAVAR